MFHQLVVGLLAFEVFLCAAACDICSHQGGVNVKVDNDWVTCSELITGATSQPGVEMLSALQGKTYTLVMSDPDAPRPAFLHWLRVDISGLSLLNGNIDGTDLPGYLYYPPSPPYGIHRYEFRIYDQTGLDTPSYSAHENGRGGFDLKAFETSNDLGSPVGTFCFEVSA